MLRELLTVNPRRVSKKKKARKRTTTTQARTTVVSNPRRRRRKSSSRRALRRNPRILGLNTQQITDGIMPALMGGLGALAMDFAIANVPLPASVKTSIATGPARMVARVALAFGAGYAAQFVTTKSNAAKVVAGGLAVVAYDGLKNLVRGAWPTIQLGDTYDGDLSGYGLGAYDQDFPALAAIDGLGYYPTGGDKQSGMMAFEEEFMGSDSI